MSSLTPSIGSVLGSLSWLIIWHRNSCLVIDTSDVHWGVLDSNLGQDTDSSQDSVIGSTQYPQAKFGPRQLPCRLSTFSVF